MIKQILILSRKQVETIIIEDKNPVSLPWALISIWNSFELLQPFSREILKNIDCQETLSIRFADLTLQEYEGVKHKREYHLFNESHAKQIISFVEKINQLDIDILIIHCAAGISRSAAVGLFICRYNNLNEEKFKQDNPRILPNYYVLSVLNNYSGINKNYVEFWESDEMKKRREKMMKFI